MKFRYKDNEFRTITTTDKQNTFPVAQAMTCYWCLGKGFTSDKYFCKDACRWFARRLLLLTTKRFPIDWDYIGQVWHAYYLKRP